MKAKDHTHRHRPRYVHPSHVHAQVYRFDESQYWWIEDLRDVHKGEEIWVIGCGPSLDDFPDGFFDEEYRIAIAVSWSALAFPNCTYNSFCKIDHPFGKYVSENRQHLLHNHIIKLRTRGMAAKPIGPQPIYMKVFGENQLEDYYQSLPNYLLNGITPPTRYGQSGSIVHWDIQAAIIMGAKKVTAAGCSGKAAKFHAYATRSGLDKVYSAADWSGGPPIEDQTGQSAWSQSLRNGVDWLARAFAPYGIQVARYFYGKGYEKII